MRFSRGRWPGNPLTKRTKLLSAVAAAVAVLLILIGGVVSRHRVRRHRVFHPAPRPQAPAAVQPGGVEQWSDQFRVLEATGRWSDLHALLGTIAKQHPDLYAKWQLAYLDARALVEMDDEEAAKKALEPFLAPNNQFRDLALFHRAEVDDGDASRWRTALIFETPSSMYRDEAIEDEIEYRASLKDARPLLDLAARLKRRDVDARVVERTGDLARGLAILHANASDDAGDRVARALDRPPLVAKMNAAQLALVAGAMQSHRHFDRAVALFSRAGASDANTFAAGRSYFGDEKFAEAQKTYLRGAAATRDPKWKATFLFHASRCAQLQGDDAGAEKLMAAVLAIPQRSDDHAAALTQRIRTRLKQRRVAEATADLNSVRAMFPKDHALVEASLAYAVGMLGLGNNGAAVVTLNAIPRNLLDKFEPYEIDYWRARALESSNPPAAFDAYLRVLRATLPTHFAYFARERLDAPAMAPKLAQALAAREAEAAKLMAAGQWDAAKRVETDRILLSSKDHPRELQRLAAIYRNLPAYREVLELAPQPFPRFPNVVTRADLLMAMGLFDEAADAIPHRWPLRPNRSALTQSLALNRGNASKESIYAIEVLMNNVPDDYVPELLPRVVRELLYPRYFYDAIAEDAKKYEADPTLVLAIMREESRFNPRAKSQAAARGLLQFIITTARDIGRDVGLVDVDPDDLYDPRVIIQLGAKYVSKLSGKLEGNRYRVAAAYNAGPYQSALWSRLQPAPGDDYFLTAINFDETKHYVRKVMNSYRRYAEIYGNAGPQGGIRSEP